MTDAVTNDAQAREGVLRELRLDPRLKAASVDVSVEDGTVTLAGVVAGAAESLAALEAARRAEGVFGVINRLQVKARRPRNDAEIATSVRRALEWDALIPHRQIQVACSNGWVALHGRVELLSAREEAERIARRMEGVRGVYNLIEVKTAEPRAENVRTAIETALRRYAQREAEDIEVTLRDGTVSLAGRVHTWAEKQAILGALNRAPGVERVNDGLSIDPYF